MESVEIRRTSHISRGKRAQKHSEYNSNYYITGPQHSQRKEGQIAKRENRWYTNNNRNREKWVPMRKFSDPGEKFEWLTTAPIPGLVGRLAVPTIISMLITSIYNMADTYFVGWAPAPRGPWGWSFP